MALTSLQSLDLTYLPIDGGIIFSSTYFDDLEDLTSLQLNFVNYEGHDHGNLTGLPRSISKLTALRRLAAHAWCDESIELPAGFHTLQQLEVKLHLLPSMAVS